MLACQASKTWVRLYYISMGRSSLFMLDITTNMDNSKPDFRPGFTLGYGTLT